MDFEVPMGGAYCFPKTLALKGEERLGPVRISLLVSGAPSPPSFLTYFCHETMTPDSGTCINN